jgi:hypothetical protein
MNDDPVELDSHRGMARSCGPPPDGLRAAEKSSAALFCVSRVTAAGNRARYEPSDFQNETVGAK